MINQKLRILHIEDSPRDAELVRESLIQEGLECEVVWVHNKEGYFAAVEAGGWDMIFADYDLPSFDAAGALAFAREKCPEVPFILISGKIGEESAIDMLKSGATDYVLKHRLSRLVPAMQRAMREIEEIRHKKQAQEEIIEANRKLAKSVEKLKLAQQQLVQQERLRALGEMAGGIAHDFNNALSPILGFTELLIAKKQLLADDPKKVFEYLGWVNTAARDAASIVSRLREFSRPREANESFTTLDIRRLIEEAVTLTEPKWKTQSMSKGIPIEISTDMKEVPSIEGNESELREVLINLIFNSVDAMPQGGKITLSAYSRNGYVFLELRDTGTGMSEDVRRRCFEPFFTTKKDHGTGLGLAMVYGIIQRHNGAIEVQGEAGQGTVFLIRLPVPETGKPQSVPEAAAACLPPLRILYVEDEPMVRRVTVEYLEGDGHNVETANNGVEGLNKFHAGRYDLVILDRAMPEMNGEQLTRKIKEIAPKKPVILLTGTPGEPLSVSVDVLVAKPVTILGLREAIAKALSKKAV